MRVSITCQPFAAARFAVRNDSGFVELPDRPIYRNESGPFCYIRHGETIELDAGAYELLVSAGIRFRPIRRRVSGGPHDVMGLHLAPRPFEPADMDQLPALVEVDLGLDASQGGDTSAAGTAEDAPLEILAENIHPELLAQGQACEARIIHYPYTEDKERWYQLLNSGHKVPAVADAGRAVDEETTLPAGVCRTLARLAPGADCAHLYAEITKGRSFLSTGPIIDIRLDQSDSDPAGVEAKSGSTVRIHVESPADLHIGRIIVDGKIKEEFALEGRQWRHEAAIDVSRDGWLAVECCGPASWHYPAGVWVHSNPIYLGRPA